MKKLLLIIFIALLFGFFNLYYMVYTDTVYYPSIPIIVGMFYAILFGVIPSAMISLFKSIFRRENTLSSFLMISIIFELIICILAIMGMSYDLSNPL